MKKTTMLKLSIRIVIILSVILFVVSFYNLFAFLGSVVTGETFGLNLIEDESSGNLLLSLDSDPQNNGVLDIGLSIELTVFGRNDHIIAQDSSSFNIKAGSNHPLSLSLSIPASMVGEGRLQGDEGYIQMKLTVRTLTELVGFSNVMKVGGVF